MYFNLTDVLKAEHETIKAMLTSDQNDGIVVDRITGIIEFVDGLMNGAKEES